MTDDTGRSVQLERIGKGRFIVRNTRGGTITIGSTEDGEFSPVELLLAAIGGCTGMDVDYITSKRAEPTEYTISVTGNKIRDEAGANRMVDLMVSFSCSQAQGDGFKWPHKVNGLTPDTSSRLAKIFEKFFGPVPPGG